MNLSGWLDRWIIKQPRLRSWLTRRLYGSADRLVSLLDTPILVNALKENGYLRAARKCRHSSFLRDEAGILINLAHFVRSNGAFIDAGANIGVYSVFFAKFRNLYRDFQVHAFEANPDTLTRLRKNAESHGFQVHAHALGATDGTLEFREGAVSHVTSAAQTHVPASIASARFTADCKRLDHTTIAASNIILKIDVEGMEWQVLEGAHRWFVEERILCVYIDGFDDPRIPDWLRALGFVLLDGRTLKPVEGYVYSLLAIHPRALPGAP